MTKRSRGMAFTKVLLASFFILASGAGAQKPMVLFDEGHGQRFLIAAEGPLQLSNLAEVLEESGLRVESTREPLSLEVLQTADGLVISGPFKPVTPGEVEAILTFVEGGGRLTVMLHIGPPAADLLRQLGIAISNGVIRETEGTLGQDAINFEVRRLEESSLFDGLDSFNIFGAWALLAQGHHVDGVATTGPSSWVDLNGDRVLNDGDAIQEFSVVVEGAHGEGRFVVFGDDTMFQNQFLRGGNRHLAGNLASWLAEGEADHETRIASVPIERSRADLSPGPRSLL